MSEEIDFNDLTNSFKDSSMTLINFIAFRGPMHIYNDRKNGNIWL